MSNIFDALQRAESEGSDLKSSTLTLATELLEAAEQKRRDSGAMLEPPASPASDDSVDSRPSAALDDLDRCPVLPVSIPADSRLVSLGKEGSLGAEKFRFLAVRLRQLRQSRPLKKVLITSTIPAGREEHGRCQPGVHLGAKETAKDLAAGRAICAAEYCCAIWLRQAPGTLRVAQRRNSNHQHLPPGRSWSLDAAGG